MTFGLVATGSAGYLIDFLDEAAAAGARMIAQTHCRGISVLLSLKTRLPFDLLPQWQELRARPVEDQLRVLGDPEIGAPFVEAAVKANYAEYTGVGAQARPPDFDGIRVFRNGLPPNPSVAEIAAIAGNAPSRSNDRSLRDFRRRSALHPAEPLSPGRRDAPAGTSAPESSHDLLRFRSTPESDCRCFDPHSPAWALGPGSR